MYGRTGLKRRLEDLRDSESIRKDPVKNLGHRAKLASWRARFEQAARRHLGNTSDVQLYGVLVLTYKPIRMT